MQYFWYREDEAADFYHKFQLVCRREAPYIAAVCKTRTSRLMVNLERQRLELAPKLLSFISVDLKCHSNKDMFNHFRLVTTTCYACCGNLYV